MLVQETKSVIPDFIEKLFAALCSLKLAVVVILLLAGALATGTILESLYDTPTSQYFVYRSLWFHLVLGALGVNIFCVAVSRWPWKPRHTPFLLAHLGILMLLGGSWATEQFGLDGSMRVSEGETASAVELDDVSLVLTEPNQVRKVRVKWLPPGVEFKPISVRERGIPYDLTIDRFLSHADPIFSFVPNAAPLTERGPLPAIHLQMAGGPMGIVQDFWLWTGDASFKTVQMGPARFAIGDKPLAPVRGQPSFSILPAAGGGVAYRSEASDGKVALGSFAPKELKGKVIEPGWKGGVKLTVLDWVSNASVVTTYKSARVQYGQQAPPAAIHVISGKGGEGSETWLGLGDRAVLHTTSGNVELGYLPHRIILPFSVRLDHFNIDRYEGSFDPSSYASQVTVAGAVGETAGPSTTISMNEPLTVKGITLYQASYEDAQPRPTVSIFSVNRDPGRRWKYMGSLLIVFGAVLLFGMKYRKARTIQKVSGVS